MALLSGFLQVAVVYAFLVLVSYRSWHRLPDPLGHDADDGVFSEARAMAHVRELADEIGGRQVGTNGVREAARYLLGNLRDIERVARETRDDLDVEIAVDSVSGSYHLDLFLTPMYLTYANLENVMLKVTPKSAERSGSALLVNAHFDSAIASPGAADCAACTAIAVEVARTIVSNQSLSLESPVIFLLNGGEETYMNAAHGFLISHPWARDIKQFINIESTGSYGPDVVFRSNSDLLLGAYLSSSPSPRANVLFQDIFNLGIMPAETDYAVFAHESERSKGGPSKDSELAGAEDEGTTIYGDLPGIDIATMFDSRSYHTALDETKRIEPGCTQNFGNNILALVLKSAELIAEARGDGMGNAGEAKDDASVAGKDWVYFDVLGLFVVAYPFAIGRVIHCLPMVVTTAAILLAKVKPRMSSVNITEGVLTFLISFICSLVFPILQFGLTGLLVQPMSWYGRPHIAALLLIPASVAGMFFPFIFSYTKRPTLRIMAQGNSQGLQQVLIGHVLGSSLVLSALGTWATLGGAMRHSGYVFVFWVLSSFIALLTKVFYYETKTPKASVEKEGGPKMQPFDLYDVTDTLDIHLPALVSIPPPLSPFSWETGWADFSPSPMQVVCIHMSLFGFLFFLDRISTMGSSMDWHGRAHADMIIGGMSGFLFFVSFGPIVPFLSHHVATSLAKRDKVSNRKTLVRTCFAVLLAATSLALAAAVCLIKLQDHGNSFTDVNPKRVFLQRLHILRDPLGHSSAIPPPVAHEGPPCADGDDYCNRVLASSLTLLGVDSVPLAQALKDFHLEGGGAEAITFESFGKEERMDHLLAAYPITRFMKDSISVEMAAAAGGEERAAVVADLPSLVTRAEPIRGGRRCHVTMASPLASYFLVNVTSPHVRAFSFTEKDGKLPIPSEILDTGVPMYGIRHVGNMNQQQSRYQWDWWMDIETPSSESEEEEVPSLVDVTWTVSNITETPTLAKVIGALPDFINPIPITTYLHAFKC